jgi:hypothetical protein
MSSLRTALAEQLEPHGGVNGLPRVNQPILDLERPTTISETELAHMPRSFRPRAWRRSWRGTRWNTAPA